MVLYVDLSEVDEAAGCGAIIRSLRQARHGGLATGEIDARRDAPVPKGCRLLVVPTADVLDASGGELRRYEGESPEVVSAVKAELEKLASAK